MDLCSEGFLPEVTLPRPPRACASLSESDESDSTYICVVRGITVKVLRITVDPQEVWHLLQLSMPQFPSMSKGCFVRTRYKNSCAAISISPSLY